MARFKIEHVDIVNIKLVDKNAHFMEQSTFRRLVENIKRDGQLSSVPFCVKHNDGKYTVISGNHRIQAAQMAGIVNTPVMVVDEDDITHDEMRAIQLSHNSIVGQDDAELLKELLDEITDVALKEYAHISNEVLDAVNDIDYTIEMPNNEIVPVTLMFIDSSKIEFDKLMDELENYSEREIESMHIMDISTLQQLNDITAKVGQRYKIKSQALSICKMIEIVKENMNGNDE